MISSNLKKLLARENINASTLGRTINVAQPSLHRLISGKNNNPTLSSLRPIADFFNVTVSQLIGEDTLNFDGSNSSRTVLSYVPLIDWTDLVAVANGSGDPQSKETVSTDASVSEQAYAFEVNHGGLEPTFPKGSKVVIDLNRDYSHGDFVLVVGANEGQPQIRQIVSDGADIYLRSPNPVLSQMKMNQLTADDQVLGVVVQVKSYY